MWQSLIGPGLSLLGGLFGNSSSSKASAAQIAGMQQGADTIKGYYNDAQGNLSPYMQTGGLANSGLQKLLGGDYSGFYDSPDFQAAMKAGGDMFDSSAAARGGVFGGGATRGREQYAQGLATQYLGNYRDFLGNTSQGGQQAAMGLGQLGANAGNSLANLYSGMGDARASNYAAQGQNNANMLGSLGGLLGGMKWGSSTGGVIPQNTSYPRNIGPYS